MSRAPSLFNKHRLIALKIAHNYYLPGGDQDDVRQEALLALWEACRAYDRDLGPLPPFARTVIRRRLADAVKASNRGKHRTLTEAGRDTSLAAGPSADPSEALDMRRRMLTLSKVERDAIAADLAGTATPYDRTQETRLRRARRKLRESA